jgi:hypothetical protein
LKIQVIAIHNSRFQNISFNSGGANTALLCFREKNSGGAKVSAICVGDCGNLEMLYVFRI